MMRQQEQEQQHQEHDEPEKDQEPVNADDSRLTKTQITIFDCGNHYHCTMLPKVPKIVSTVLNFASKGKNANLWFRRNKFYSFTICTSQTFGKISTLSMKRNQSNYLSPVRWRVRMNIISEWLFANCISLLLYRSEEANLHHHFCIIVYLLYVKYACAMNKNQLLVAHH